MTGLGNLTTRGNFIILYGRLKVGTDRVGSSTVVRIRRSWLCDLVREIL